MFAYGQTSSGKTHTCLGPNIEDEELKGVIPRLIDDIFQKIVESPSEIEFRIKVTRGRDVVEHHRDLHGANQRFTRSEPARHEGSRK